MDEFELKFQVPQAALAAVMSGMRGGEQSRLRATYYDTAAGALASQGLALRVRQEGDRWVQAAKGPPRGFDRPEEEVCLAARPARGDPELHRGTRMYKLLRDALDAAGATADELQPLYSTEVDRVTRVVQAAGTTVEIALDTGTVRAGDRSQPIREIEFELKGGDASVVVELARQWCSTHSLWLDPLSKAGRGLRLARAQDTGEPVKARPASGSRVRGTPQLLAGMIDSALSQALANLREIAAGQAADEHVHQARVGLRRLRSVLRELGELPELAQVAEETRQPLAVLFRQLGNDRDRRVLVPAIESAIRAAGGPHLTWELPPAADRGAAVRAPQVQGALLLIVGWLAAMRTEPPAQTSLGDTRKLVAKRMARLQQRVLEAGARFDALGEEDRHGVRKQAKRLRYLAELAMPLFDEHKVDRYTHELEALQDALGEYQDYATALALWSDRVLVEPGAAFGCGWLVARQDGSALRAAKLCRDARRQLKPFWTVHRG
ncbi:MAG: CHAD domain-containing protein [Burkholderiales bacterium]|nr:CHAD domain-containing protein [Burkholderiales bacterium]